ncbi:MAG: Bacterial regulatory protein luxR family [Novosphingobium sp.]|nr:Bacterial regulatory protein luxR family [Novosphingobium sp.]
MNIPTESLVPSIQTVDEIAMAESQPRQVPPHPQPFDLDELTLRQLETMRLLASGLTQKRIAQAMGITVNTVKDHLAAIQRKARATNRCQLVALFAAQYKDAKDPEANAPHK